MNWVALLVAILLAALASYVSTRERRQADVDKGAADQRADDAAATSAAEDRAGKIRDDLAQASDDDIARRIDGL